MRLGLLCLALGICSASARESRKISKRAVGSGCVTTYDGNCYSSANLGNGIVRFTIPYAEPPVGSLRFSLPRARGLAESSALPVQKGQANGSALKQGCPQSEGPTGVSLNEDCLFVNVYSPSGATNTSSLPVYVYLHGGSRSANDPGINGKALVPQGNIVLVTVEYRQGAFGFFKQGGRLGASGNAGLMDVVTALQWVQSNIRFFGGSSSKVTLGGQSTGASIVKTLLAVPEAETLFNQAILQSAPLNYNDPTPAQADGLAANVLYLASCEDVACLRTRSVEDILGAAAGAGYYSSQYALGPDWYIPGISSGQPFVPFVDGQIVQAQGQNVLSGQYSGIFRTNRKLLLSTVANEAGPAINVYTKGQALPASAYNEMINTLLLPPRNATVINSKLYPVSATAADTRVELEKMGNDYIWRCANQQIAVSGTKSYQAPIYLAEFRKGIPYPTTANVALCKDKKLVCHEDDLFLTFGTGSTDSSSPLTSQTTALSKEVVERWLAFIKTGNPNVSGYTNWPAVSSATKLNLLLLGSGSNGSSSLVQSQEAKTCGPNTLWGESAPFDYQLFGV